MPRRHDARDQPAEAGPVRFPGRLAELLSHCRAVRGWRRPRIVVAGITAVAAAVAIIASSGASGVAGSAWWSITVIAAGTLLAGLTVGSYLGPPIGAEATVCDTRWPILGLAGLALGSSAGPDSLLAYLFSWATPTVLGAVIQPAVSLAAVALLGWALRHRLTTLLVALAFFIGSLQLIPFIPTGLFSSSDTGISTIAFDLPPGATLADSEQVMTEVSDRLQANPAVSSVLATATNVNSGTIYVNLVPQAERVSQAEFEQTLRRDFQTIPGARVSFQSTGGTGNSKDLSIVLKSENAPLLLETATTLEQQMGSVPGLVDISSSASLVKPELIIQPDPQRAADLGVSVAAISRTASLALIGDNDFNLPKFNLSDRQIPIRVQLDPAQRSNIETLKNLQVPSNTGELVPLAAVAELKLGSGSAQIDRFNRFRQVEVGANLEGTSLGDAFAAVNALPVMNPLPSGVTIEPAGDAEIMRDIFSRFLTALGAAVLCIYAILVLLYNNFLYPFGILTALPLSIGGALLGLMITQKELGLFALIGIVLLMGLVTKNAILLVDFTLSGLREGKTLKKSLVEAGVSRLRPICMTSLSTIAGMLPIALELGADGATRSPMAIAVIGGFSTSTVLTLIVVPVIFTYIYRFVRWLVKPFQNAQSAPL